MGRSSWISGGGADRVKRPGWGWMEGSAKDSKAINTCTGMVCQGKASGSADAPEWRVIVGIKVGEPVWWSPVWGAADRTQAIRAAC